MDYRYDHILIRYGELSLKGKNRNSFIKQLMVNVKKALKSFETLEFERQHDRMYIYLHDENAEQVSEVLKRYLVFLLSHLRSKQNQIWMKSFRLVLIRRI